MTFSLCTIWIKLVVSRTAESNIYKIERKIMKLFTRILTLALMVIPVIAYSHGAPRLKVEESIIINAKPADVWNVIKNFDSINTWHPAIESTNASGNDNGATRTLTLTNGGTIDEKLKKIDSEKMIMNYEITNMSNAGEIDDHGEPHEVPVVPVSKYKAWLSVKADGEGSKVTWKGKFFRAYHGHQKIPPKELDDNTAKAAISGIYKAGLENLKAQMEK